MVSQLAANLCRDYVDGLRGMLRTEFVRVFLHINPQEQDSYFSSMLEIKTVDISKFADEEKWIDNVGSKLSNLSKSIEQEIFKGKDLRSKNSRLGLPTSILLYLPEGKSFKQTVEQLKLNPYLKQSVSFDYFGKISSNSAYPHFTGENQSEDRSAQFKTKTNTQNTVSII